MPYKDPEKQRKAVRRSVRRYRARKKAEAEARKDAVAISKLKPFIESCPLPEGGTFRLRNWQAKFLAGCLQDDVKIALLSLGRGGGKTGLLGIISALYTVGPLNIPGYEITLVSGTGKQAKPLFASCKAAIEPHLHLGKGPGHDRLRNNPQGRNIEVTSTNTELQVIAADGKTALGARPILIIGDEAAYWHPDEKARELYDALKTGLGKVKGSKMILISTRGDGTSFFDELLEVPERKGIFKMVFEGDREKPLSPESIKAANPDMTPELRDAINDDIEDVKAGIMTLQKFMRKRLNLVAKDDKQQNLIDAETWKRCELPEGDDGKSLQRGPYILGIDIGGAAAQTAISAFYPETKLLKVLSAFPKKPGLKKRGRKDDAPYFKMFERGELLLLGNRIVPIHELLAVALEEFGYPAWIVGDYFRQAELLQALESAMIDIEPEFRRNGPFDGSEDVRNFQKACLEQQIKTPVNLLMRWALSGAVTIENKYGSCQLAKGSENGRRQSHRDDSVCASLLSVSAAMRHDFTIPQEEPSWELIQ